jgi:histidinol-phosphate phosphatase family protein
MSPDSGRRAVFLDRDGTVIEDVGYPSDPDEVRLIAGAAEGIRLLRKSGLATVIISNQSGVGRGLFTMTDLERVHARTSELLSEAGAELDGAYYCPHAPDAGCDCRKPATGLIERARRELGISHRGCIFIGDKASDVEAGAAAGCETVLFGDTESAAVEPTWHAADWPETIELLIGRPK